MWYAAWSCLCVCMLLHVGEGKVWLCNFEYQNQIFGTQNPEIFPLFSLLCHLCGGEGAHIVSIRLPPRFCTLGSNNSSCTFLWVPWNSFPHLHLPSFHLKNLCPVLPTGSEEKHYCPLRSMSWHSHDSVSRGECGISQVQLGSVQLHSKKQFLPEMWPLFSCKSWLSSSIKCFKVCLLKLSLCPLS